MNGRFFEDLVHLFKGILSEYLTRIQTPLIGDELLYFALTFPHEYNKISLEISRVYKQNCQNGCLTSDLTISLYNELKFITRQDKN